MMTIRYRLNSGIRESERFHKFVKLCGFGEPFAYGFLLSVWEWILKAVSEKGLEYTKEELVRGAGWVRQDSSIVLNALLYCGSSGDDGYLLCPRADYVVPNFKVFEEYFSVIWVIVYDPCVLDTQGCSEQEAEEKLSDIKIELCPYETDFTSSSLCKNKVYFGSYDAARSWRIDFCEHVKLLRDKARIEAALDFDK